MGSLDDLDAEEQRWRPPTPTANSLLGIAKHALAIAEDNVLGVLGGHDVQRERATEFDVQGLTREAMREQWNRLEPQVKLVLQHLPVSILAAEGTHPRRGRITGFDVLLVALRHAAEHQGEADLTRNLVLAQREEGSLLAVPPSA